jgi:hypothetical protein
MKKVLFLLSFFAFLSCNHKKYITMNTQEKVSVLIRFNQKMA